MSDIKSFKAEWEKKHGPIQTFQQAARMAQAFEMSTLEERQKKYGPDNIRRRGEIGIFIRMHDDKGSRLENVYFNRDGTPKSLEQQKGQEMGDESIDDAWMDTANYATIALMVRAGVWGLPLEGKP
jgi:hypothetical protein